MAPDAFREIRADEPLAVLIADKRWRADAYYAVALKAREGGYLVGVFPAGHSTYREKIDHYVAMKSLAAKGFRVRGLRADTETLSKTFAEWLATEHVHPTVTMFTAEGDEVEIDAALVPLLAALGARGVRTMHSCQGGTPTPTGTRPGYVTYEADGHELVVEVIAEAGLTNVEYLPGPRDHPYLRSVEFDPIA